MSICPNSYRLICKIARFRGSLVSLAKIPDKEKKVKGIEVEISGILVKDRNSIQQRR